MSAAVRFTNETREVTFGFFVKNDLSDAENDQILTFSVKMRANLQNQTFSMTAKITAFRVLI